MFTEKTNQEIKQMMLEQRAKHLANIEKWKEKRDELIRKYTEAEYEIWAIDQELQKDHVTLKKERN